MNNPPHDPSGTPPSNPYTPPAAAIHPQASPTPDSSRFVPNGRQVPAGNGGSWIGGAWSMFAGAPFTWMGIWLLFMLLLMVVTFIPLGQNLALPLMMGGIMLGCERWRQYRTVEMGDLFAGFQRHTGPLVIQGLLYTAGVFIIFVPAGILMLIGIILGAAASNANEGAMLTMMLLIALGSLVMAALLLPLMAAIWFAPVLIVLHDIAPLEAMKQSFYACFKNWLPMTVYSLLFIVLSVVAAIPCGLGLLVVCPWMMLSVYSAYRDIFFET